MVTGNGYFVLDILNAFEKIIGKKINYTITDRRLGDVPQLYADINLAKEKLGWTAKRDLENMIDSAWKWEQNVRSEQNEIKN